MGPMIEESNMHGAEDQNNFIQGEEEFNIGLEQENNPDEFIQNYGNMQSGAQMMVAANNKRVQAIGSHSMNIDLFNINKKLDIHVLKRTLWDYINPKIER